MVDEQKERDRLRVLQSFEILDTEEESAFDDFTRLVSHFLKVPIALISLVDEQRQWFKSYVGVDVRETDRDIAFCDVAIQTEEILIVPDALTDVRFQSNPLVTHEPHIRFYAGVPLMSSEGHAIGTLCAIDTQPRDLEDSEAEILAILARQVMAQLELRRVTTRALRAEVEHLKLENKLQETQRLDSLAVLAGGIAHDFNNLLVSILGNANLATMELPDESPVKATIGRIETASKRAAELTKQMLAYSGTGNRESTIVDLSILVEEMGHLLEVSISRKVVLNFDLERDATKCRGDATQIRQVLMNLLVNGSDAIGDRSGTITVRTGMTRLDEDYLLETLLPDYVSPGDFVLVEIADTGRGMSAEDQARMFDPFFTTKSKGRGLGLAAVLGIVRSHGGTIVVYSSEGKGTTIRILFPAVESAVTSDPAPRPARRGNGELILVVDDEDHVRSVTATMLERLGFRVLTAVDGDSGVATYQASQQEIDVVLLDMTMPHMSGAEAFKMIREIDPQARVVLMSGHVEEDATTEIAGRRWSGFLQKPFSSDDLINKMLTVLDTERAPARE